MTRQRLFDVARGFHGNVLPPVTFTEALHRVGAYCTDPASGWSTYDLSGVEARLDGHLETISPWSLLWANALAGRVQVRDLAAFNVDRREDLAGRLLSIPVGEDLRDLDSAARAAVAAVCQFGFEGVWAPKTTKLAALYRPQAVPVLDGYVALAFGFSREGFSQGHAPRWARIARVVDALGSCLDAHRESLSLLREASDELVPDLSLIPDLRLLDIIIWTSQDDRMQRPGKPANYWVNIDLSGRRPITRDDVSPISLTTGLPMRRDLPPGFGHWPPPRPEFKPTEESPRMRWVEVDLSDLEYEPWRQQRWYDRVPWTRVMEALEPHVVIGADVDAALMERLLPGLPRLVQEGVASLFAEPLGIQPGGHPIGGGHRMFAMRRQGLTHAYGMN